MWQTRLCPQMYSYWHNRYNTSQKTFLQLDYLQSCIIPTFLSFFLPLLISFFPIYYTPRYMKDTKTSQYIESGQNHNPRLYSFHIQQLDDCNELRWKSVELHQFPDGFPFYGVKSIFLIHKCRVEWRLATAIRLNVSVSGSRSADNIQHLCISK